MTGTWINPSRNRSGPDLELITTKGTEVSPTKRGSDAWLARQAGRWAKLAQKVRSA